MTRIKLYLAAALAGVTAILAALFRARKTGEKLARADMKEKDHAEADQVRDRVRDARAKRLSDDDLRFRD